MSRTIGIALAGVISIAAAGAADANGRGAAGPVFHIRGAVHAAGERQFVGTPARFDERGGHRPPFRAGTYAGGMRPLPGVSGTIHERPGRSPYFTGIGHLDTGWRPELGIPARRAYGGYEGARRFGEAARGFGRTGAGLAHDRRVYEWRYGSAGGAAGGYADGGGDAGGPGTQPGFAEAPLAATYAEPPLGPSPYGGYPAYSGAGTAATAWDGYGGGPQIIVINNGNAPRAGNCACGAERPGPVVYRYGIGTAY